MNTHFKPTRLSSRLSAVRPSPTIAITRLANELRRQGRDVIGLSQGEPDFDTPAHVKEAAKAAIDAGATKYTDVDGTPELKRAIVGKFRNENGLSYDVSQISVGTGGKQVLYNALCATLDAGDEVIIPAPYWVSYPDMVLLAGGQPVIVPCDEADGFKLSAPSLRTAITPRTKWLVLNSPSNPTGAGYSAADLKAIADVLLDHPQVMVLTDDMYEHIRYDGWQFATIAAVEPRLFDRVLTCNGVSKAYAMTGWRIGYAAGPADIITAMGVLQSQSTSNASSVGQAAALAALTGDQSFISEWAAIYRARRDKAVALINAVPGLSCRTPGGAFYLFVNCGGLIGKRTPQGKTLATDSDVVMFFLENAGVALVAGSAYGVPGFFRMSTATSIDIIEQGIQALQEVIATLQ